MDINKSAIHCSYIDARDSGRHWTSKIQLICRNNRDLISEGRLLKHQMQPFAVSLYVLGVYQLPSHQQPSSGRGPGAELVMGSTGFGFRVFTILMLGNRYLIYQIGWRTGCLLASNMHLIVYLFSFNLNSTVTNGKTSDQAVLPWINTFQKTLFLWNSPVKARLMYSIT